MENQSKNIKQALDELESRTQANGTDFRARLQAELSRIEAMLKNMTPDIGEISSRVEDEVKKTKVKVETQVQENPWAAIGIVGLVFLLLGFILGWKGSRSRD